MINIEAKELFPEVRKISSVAQNILKKRYFHENEDKWEDICDRVIKNVIPEWNKKDKELMKQMLVNTYFIPNSPCLVNAGKSIGGLCACFVVDFPDNIEGIFKTKLDFALIARKGGGAGTSLSKIRPEGARVAGSTHGYAGGGVKFANTISHDANALTQSGFRNMAIMFTESVFHPDIIKFITAKSEEGKIENANISVVVDDRFMNAVKNNEKYWTEFEGVKYQEYDAKTIFDLIIEGMWKNGEPGILLKNRIDDSPYKYTGQEIFGTNPCVTGNTLIRTVLGDIEIKRLVGKEIYVYCLDNIGQLVTGKAYNIRKTQKNAELIKISANGNYLICTPVLIYTYNKGYVKAKDLDEKDRLIYHAETTNDEIKIEYLSYKEDVYDLEVERYHNFFANNIMVHNCSEQPLPPNGVCNLGSLDLSKFLDKDKKVDFEKLEIATRLGVRFLDSVIDATGFPTEDIAKWAVENRAIGLGIMAFADYCLMKEIAYGSQESLNELSLLLDFIYKVAEDESIKMGKELGVPKMCKKLPVPRRNITLLTVAPTGTISLIAGCSSGLEPIFSEMTIRHDRTGTYTFENNLASKPYFRCAVSSNGIQEVTWEEHINVLATAQKYIDSGVSKTINFPTGTHRDTIAKAVMMAWEKGCKGVAVYRNGSREVEVLSPKNIQKNICPLCNSELVMINDKLYCTKCTKETIVEKITATYD